MPIRKLAYKKFKIFNSNFAALLKYLTPIFLHCYTEICVAPLVVI